MPNIELERKKDLSAFRTIAIGTWKNAYDPSVYGTLELRMEKALQYLTEFRAKKGKKLTVTHMLAKACAMVLAECPDANVILRFNRIYLRKRIGVFFQVVMTDEGPGKIDLSGATLFDLEQKSLEDIYDEFAEKVALVRSRKDPSLERSRNNFKLVPSLTLNWVFRILSIITYSWNLDLSRFGIPKDPFGSLMITNIGSLGLDTGYVPLVPYSRVPILVAVGAVRDEAVVDDGKLGVGKVMKIHATFDHRIIDGYHASVMSKVLRAWMENPYEHFGSLE